MKLTPCVIMAFVWNNNLSIYAVIDCGQLRDIRNGRVVLTGTTVGSTATYSCNKGYILIGQETRTCQVTGEWNAKEPFCQRKPSIYQSGMSRLFAIN